jgi:hypothetical protein
MVFGLLSLSSMRSNNNNNNNNNNATDIATKERESTMETIKDEVKVDLNVTQSIFVFVSGEPISEVHIRTTGVRPEIDVNGKALLDHGVSRPISSHHGVILLVHIPTLHGRVVCPCRLQFRLFCLFCLSAAAVRRISYVVRFVPPPLSPFDGGPCRGPCGGRAADGGAQYFLSWGGGGGRGSIFRPASHYDGIPGGYCAPPRLPLPFGIWAPHVLSRGKLQ